MIERSVNNEGQEQIIKSLDKIVKIDDKYMQVRLVRTQKWKDRSKWTPPMPRAKFVQPEDDVEISYIIDRNDLIELKEKAQKPCPTCGK